MRLQSAFLFASLFLIEGVGLCQGGEISRTLISEEAVPVVLKEGSVTCRDATHPPMFPTEGHIFVNHNDVFDRTFRVPSGLGTQLPNTLTCAEIQSDLAKVPSSLTGVRKVYSVYKESSDSQIVTSLLVAELEFEIPVQFEGKNIILKSEETWVEDFAAKNNSGTLYQPLPHANAYSVVTHPQAGDADTGLHCSRSPNTLENQLTLGGVSGHDDYGDALSNIRSVSRNFRSKEDCEDYRSETLKRFIAEDPNNNGSLIKVNRKIETSFRYLADIQACQEIEVESINTRIGTLKFTAVKVFPIRMVDFEKCRSLKRT